MIKSKLELKFYIASDRIMNGFPAKRNLIQILKEFVSPQKDILRFLRLLRKVQYYNSKKGLLSKLISILIKIRYNRTSQKLGFSIDYSSFGYGLVIPHYGTIVVGGPNKIGNFAVLHTSTCIAGGGKTIGDGLYLSSGSQIIGFIATTMTISILSYYLIEKQIKVLNSIFFVWCVAAVLTILPAGYLYLHAGVVRDIPELDVVKGLEHRGQFAEYCDRVYQYKNYPKENGKPNVLVVGVSFGRDFANILLESDYCDSINLVYGYTWDEKDLDKKVSQSDYIFSFSSPDVLPSFVSEKKKPNCKIMGIGTKNYGSCNGIIYKNRSSVDYFKQVAEIEDYGYILLNQQWKKAWGGDYIDLLTPAMTDQNHVRVFTDDNRYISQDCRHLTPAGAQWYAQILDWKNIFKEKQPRYQ